MVQQFAIGDIKEEEGVKKWKRLMEKETGLLQSGFWMYMLE